MYFSKEAVETLEKDLLTVRSAYRALQERFLLREYKSARSYEHAAHGFVRRVKFLYRCIENTFTLLPPSLEKIPSSSQIDNASLNIQAFVINTFGCTHNLAWIWVNEFDLRKDDGNEIPRNWIGLSKSNRFVRESFPKSFQNYLEGLDSWFGYLENYRHALAHRIPLYVPPYAVVESKADEYHEIGDRMGAALRDKNFDEYEKLSAQQENLAIFQPVMMHSFEEKAKTVVFHAQLIADFKTIEELGYKMIEQLDNL